MGRQGPIAGCFWDQPLQDLLHRLQSCALFRPGSGSSFGSTFRQMFPHQPNLDLAARCTRQDEQF